MTLGLRILLVLAGVVAFIVGFNYLGDVRDWNRDTHNCQTLSVPGSKDAADRDSDLIEFARAAAEARRADGRIRTADHYDRIADRAQRRQDRTSLRASIPCDERYPKPSLLGL